MIECSSGGRFFCGGEGGVRFLFGCVLTYILTYSKKFDIIEIIT